MRDIYMWCKYKERYVKVAIKDNKIICLEQNDITGKKCPMLNSNICLNGEEI